MPFLPLLGIIAAGYVIYNLIDSNEDPKPSITENDDDENYNNYNAAKADANRINRRKKILEERARALIAEFDLAEDPDVVANWLSDCAGNPNWQNHLSGGRLLAALKQSKKWKTQQKEIQKLENEIQEMKKLQSRLDSIGKAENRRSGKTEIQ